MNGSTDKVIGRILEAVKTDIRCDSDRFLCDAETHLELSASKGAIDAHIKAVADCILEDNANAFVEHWDADARWYRAALREVTAYATELYGDKLKRLVAAAEAAWLAEQVA